MAEPSSASTSAAACTGPVFRPAAVVGFATALAMWTLGYLLRLPGEAVPPVITGVVLLLIQAGGGIAAGRWAIGSNGWQVGLGVGAIAGLINLMVLGSLLVEPERTNAVRPDAWIAVLGYLVFSGALGAGAGWVGERFRPGEARAPTSDIWLPRFAIVTTIGAFVLLLAGGVVTGARAGLAVPDWPRSFGANMFLYPLSRMTGDVYIEHSHRLLGALVGLTTLTLALWTIGAGRGRWRQVGLTALLIAAVLALSGVWTGHLTANLAALLALAAGAYVVQMIFTDAHRLPKTLALIAVAMVLFQGWLGGARVIQQNVGLAMVHGITGQFFVALLATLAAVVSVRWREGGSALQAERQRTSEPTTTPQVGDLSHQAPSSIQTALNWLAVIALVIQIAFGAATRHFDLQTHALISHIAWSIVALALLLAAGMRSAKVHAETPLLRAFAKAMMHTAGLQMVLGLLALWTSLAYQGTEPPPAIDVAMTTAHQGVGAALLVVTSLHTAWTSRLRRAPIPPRPE